MSNQTFSDIQVLLIQPFIDGVITSKAPDGFKMSAIENYDGLSDPIDHLQRYISLMEITRANDTILRKAFSSTLKEAASA